MIGSLILFLFVVTSLEVAAQGPPINTDTPIMLGLEGRGVRTFGKVVRKATLRQDGEEISDPNDGAITVWVVPVAIPSNLFSDRFQVTAILPFINIDLQTNAGNSSSSGIGDLRFFLKYLLYQFDRKNETFRIASKAGIKLPTGDETEMPSLGSGSTDYFFSTVFGWIKKRIGIYLEGIFNLNTSHRQVDFGNTVAYNLALGYRLVPAVYETYPQPQLNGFLEINGTGTAKNKVNGERDENSGGNIIFLSPGVQFVGGRRWLVETSFQYPIVNAPDGIQLSEDWTISLGIRVLIF